MKNLILSIMCACLAVTAVAGVQRPDVARLRQSLQDCQRSSLSSAGVNNTALVSLPQYMRERHLKSASNRLNGNASHRLTTDEMAGTRITVIDMQAIVGFDEDGQPLLNDTVCSNAWKSTLSCVDDNGNYVLKNFYGHYDVPIEVNLESGTVVMGSCLLQEDTTRYESGLFLYETIYKDYLVTRDLLFDYIDAPLTGTIYDDGSIMLDGASVVYTMEVRQKLLRRTHALVSCDTLAQVSPMFNYICIMMPNGVHSFDNHLTSVSSSLPSHSDVSSQLDLSSFSGYTFVNGMLQLSPCGGGKRKKPIDPRNPASGSTALNGSKPDSWKPIFLRDVEFATQKNPFSLEPFGGGKGKHPIDPRKSATRGFDWPGGVKLTGSLEQAVWEDMTEQHYDEPIFMYQANDSLLVVYNLFGRSNTINCMFLHDDGTMVYPGQEVLYDDYVNDDFSNLSCSSGTMELGNTGEVAGDTISWDMCVLYGLNQYYHFYYDNNKLYYTDGNHFLVGKADMPNLTVEWTDDTVTFTAVTAQEGATVCLATYEPAGEDIANVTVVNNPYVVARTEVEQTIYLAAIADGHEIGKNPSDWSIGQFTVPVRLLRGDANNNRVVNIADVTCMINYMLNGEAVEAGDFNIEAADVNSDATISIADVTALINQLLNE